MLEMRLCGGIWRLPRAYKKTRTKVRAFLSTEPLLAVVAFLLQCTVLSFHASECDTGYDVLGKQELDHEERKYRQGESQIDGTKLRLEDVTPQEGNHHRHRVQVIVRQDDLRQEEFVPLGHEREDCLRGDGRLHYREGYHIEGVELLCPVDTGGFDDFKGKRGLHVLPHKKHHGRRCNYWQYERQEVVRKPDLIDHLVKTDRDDLSRNHHDCHDEREEGAAELPGVHDERVCGQRGEIHCKAGRTRRDYKGVHEALQGVKALSQQDIQVAQEESGRDKRDCLLLDFVGGTGGVYDHLHEREEAHQRQDDTDDVYEGMKDMV